MKLAPWVRDLGSQGDADPSPIAPAGRHCSRRGPSAPANLVGYLQDVGNDRLDLDLVTVTAYDVVGLRVLVPHLIEPDRAIAELPAAARTPSPEPPFRTCC